MVDDEDDDVQVDTDDDEEREQGSEGEDTGGEDTAGRDAESDLSTKRAGDEGDEGAPPKGKSASDETQPRGSARFQRLANENREYRERLDRIERDRENERQQWQRQQQQLNEAQERDRLALMTPDEKLDYYRARDRNEVRQEMQQLRLQTAMQTDKAAFDAKATINPVYRRMQSAVEDMFAEQVRKGQPTDRETILYHLLGKQAVSGAGNTKPRQQARRRVENQRVTPSSGKGDTARRSGSAKMSTAEERLKDVLI